MRELENSHKQPPTCSDGMQPYSLGDSSRPKSLVLIYHDETTFHANDGLRAGWHEKGKWPLKPKDQGRGIMVIDFVDEHNGYLRLSEDEIRRRDETDPTIPLLAREVIEIGESHEGYFTSDKFCLQVAKAARIASFKYSIEEYNVVWVFDQAKIHVSYDSDALIASRMNVNPGGQQPVMRTSSYMVHGAPQRMTKPDGTPKGLKLVLEEGGVDTQNEQEDMIAKLNEFPDFKNEQNKVARLLH